MSGSLLLEQARHWWMEDGMERKESERGFREDNTLISSWTELENKTKLIQDRRQ